MTIPLNADGHVHTALCRHAVGTMEEYVVAALAAGLEQITFLEHLEVDIAYEHRTWLTADDFDTYFAEGKRLRQVYGKRLAIGLGVEVGFNPECPEQVVKQLSMRTWDRVGLSYHFHRLPGTDVHLNLLSRKKANLDLMKHYGADKLLSDYFAVLIDAVPVVPADVLCHLDAGLRHLPGRKLNADHRRQVTALLERVSAAGMAVEINTSGFDIYDAPFPAPDIINLAQEMGITLLPGSDAHRPAEVGRHFHRIPSLLSSALRR